MSERVYEDPWPLLARWLPSNDNPDRPEMTVATVAPDGLPDARTMLLTEYDVDGFYFHTDSRSRKVAELAAHPGVALVLRFPDQLRQLVVQGLAEPADDDELRRAYRSRSLYLQQLAWQNTVEFASLPLGDRQASWTAFRNDHPEGFSQPPTWVGYLVRPLRLSFWTGSPDTASRRLEYTREASTDRTWAVQFLAG